MTYDHSFISYLNRTFQKLQNLVKVVTTNTVCPPVNLLRFQYIQLLAGPKGQQQIGDFEILVYKLADKQ